MFLKKLLNPLFHPRFWLVFAALVLLAASDGAFAASKQKTGRKTGKTASSSAPVLAALNMSAPTSKLNLFAPRPVHNGQLETVALRYSTGGGVALAELPAFRSEHRGALAGMGPNREVVYYTLDPELQAFTERLVSHARAPHVAIVAMDPNTGKILSLAGKSPTIRDIPLHAGFPAASLFKVVTAAAAIERSNFCPESVVHFRGGTYTSNKSNYKPDGRRDRQKMTLAEAMGRSCNPVFARVALKALQPVDLKSYATAFGYNIPLLFDTPLAPSQATIPYNEYVLSRTSAGFGEVTLSPVHAAAIMSGVANGGLLPRPALIQRVVSPAGNTVYETSPRALRRLVKPDTAQQLLTMMEYTTTMGTSRREFMKRNRRVLPFRVAAKTGTLRGSNPFGLNQWFIAAAPLERPTVAVAVIIVDPAHRYTRASQLGRLLLQKHLGVNGV